VTRLEAVFEIYDGEGQMVDRFSNHVLQTAADIRQKGVLVAGAHSMGALGVIRSLGRAGYDVHAVSSVSRAIGLRSAFLRSWAVHPPGDASTFEEWVVNFIGENNIGLIIPGGPISPGHPALRDYGHLFALSKDDGILSKARKFELFASLSASREQQVSANLPPTIFVNFDADLPTREAISVLPIPMYIKLDGAHARGAGEDKVIAIQSVDEALDTLGALQRDYHQAIIQGFVPGVGVGAFFLRWKGKVLARFMHRRLHEMPHTGGASSLRESWRHGEILEDAEQKLAHIGWEGVAMVEYRWDPATDKFYLMEMNLRFWGSLHLALYSGVDFPQLLADAFWGRQLAESKQWKLGIKCRNTIPFEIGYLVSLWRDGRVPLPRKLHSIWEGLWLTLDWRVKNDLLFPGDRRLFFYRLAQFLRTGT
jgi:hypothetical protein